MRTAAIALEWRRHGDLCRNAIFGMQVSALLCFGVSIFALSIASDHIYSLLHTSIEPSFFNEDRGNRSGWA